MTDTHSEKPAKETVTISQDNELRLNSGIYDPHFITTEYVHLGTNREWDLIFVRPVDVDAEDSCDAITDYAYKIDDTRYTGEVSCQGFLQEHNYHHTTTMRYVAEWWPDNGILCVDLTDPVASTAAP